MQSTIFLAAMLSLGQSGEPIPAQRTQIFFAQPAEMKVFWLTRENGKDVFSKTPIEAPGRYNFRQGFVYRLKLTHLPSQPGLELFPTLEVATANAKSREFLAHNSVPIQLTKDEIAQVVKGGFVVKVIYLPTQQNGDTVSATVTGQDGLREATKRGNVLVILRIGNIDAAK